MAVDPSALPGLLTSWLDHHIGLMPELMLVLMALALLPMSQLRGLPKRALGVLALSAFWSGL